jgi:hypothetical protein
MPIEFPSTCEVYINEVQIKTSLKGMKRKPGTAPPPDLNIRDANLEEKNEVRMLYINAGPANATEREFKVCLLLRLSRFLVVEEQLRGLQKFYLLVQFVEMHPISGLVESLRQTAFTPAEDVRRKMREAMTADDDIIAGTLKLPLKCPVSRLPLPCFVPHGPLLPFSSATPAWSRLALSSLAPVLPAIANAPPSSASRASPSLPARPAANTRNASTRRRGTRSWNRR